MADTELHGKGTEGNTRIFGIAFDMTPPQALTLAEDIFLLADFLRNDLGIRDDISEETRRMLVGALGLIAHAANVLTEYIGEHDTCCGGCRHE